MKSESEYFTTRCNRAMIWGAAWLALYSFFLGMAVTAESFAEIAAFLACSFIASTCCLLHVFRAAKLNQQMRAISDFPVNPSNN